MLFAVLITDSELANALFWLASLGSLYVVVGRETEIRIEPEEGEKSPEKVAEET